MEVGGNGANNASSLHWDGVAAGTPLSQRISRNTGVFWRPAPDRFRMPVAYISSKDGTTQTILYGENANSRRWYSNNTLDIGLFIHAVPAGSLQCSPPDLWFSPSVNPDGSNALIFTRIDMFTSRINANKGTAPGVWPFASSFHPQGANFVFVDGHAKFLSDSIDKAVYGQLFTPGGQVHGQPTLGDDF